jgi:hypothetical protein
VGYTAHSAYIRSIRRTGHPGDSYPIDYELYVRIANPSTTHIYHSSGYPDIRGGDSYPIGYRLDMKIAIPSTMHIYHPSGHPDIRGIAIPLNMDWV